MSETAFLPTIPESSIRPEAEGKEGNRNRPRILGIFL